MDLEGLAHLKLSISWKVWEINQKNSYNEPRKWYLDPLVLIFKYDWNILYRSKSGNTLIQFVQSISHTCRP